MTPAPAPPWRRVENWAAALYLALALLLGFDAIGLQHDECLLLHGAVQILRSPEPPPVTLDAYSWIEVGGRSWPLMVVPYAGAIKHYVALAPFAIFGPSPWVARAVAALLGATGVWGLGAFLRREAGAGVAAAAAFALALHPGYLVHTLYINGGIGLSFAVVGLLAVAIGRYRRAPTRAMAFLIGILTGLGVWDRANFLWLAGSVLAGALLAGGRRFRVPLAHAGVFTAGGLLGGAPLLIYQVRSDWEIFSTFRALASDLGTWDRIQRTLPRLFDTLFVNVELRWVWGGPQSPAWQHGLVLGVVALGVAASLSSDPENPGRASLRRAMVIALLLFVAVMTVSPVLAAPHHLLAAIPLAFASAALGYQRLWGVERLRVWIAAAALMFAGLLLLGDILAIRGIRATRGTRCWSSAINEVTRHLLTRHPNRRVTILDWGLTNNLFVLSNGSIPFRELYFGGDRLRAGDGATWDSVVSKGGLFLVGAGNHVHLPEPGAGFRQALSRSGLASRSTLFREASGQPYAELVEVARAASTPRTVPRVGRVTPPSTRAGSPFQVQSDGSSALSIEGENFGPASVVVLGGRSLPTTYGGPGLLTAIVPRDLYTRTGRLELTVVDPQRGSSEPLFFEVIP